MYSVYLPRGSFAYRQVIASGVVSQKAVVLSAADKNFQTLPELTDCIRASMLIPGICGDIVRLKVRDAVLVLYFGTMRAQ
jgi:hypothetical protein